MLARSVLDWTAADWLSRSREPASAAFLAAYHPLITRRVDREPVAYLTGVREFFGRPFRVTRDVLIPRPETELLVEVVLGLPSRPSAPTVADVGTGSGCIAVTLALEWRAARIQASDVSLAALEVAAENARVHGVGERVTFRHGPLLSAGRGPFDVIVANLPYVPTRDRAALEPEVAAHEPAVALFGGADGLDVIGALVEDAASALNVGGVLALEIGQGQADAVCAHIERTPGLTVVDVHPDLRGVPRVVLAARTGAP